LSDPAQELGIAHYQWSPTVRFVLHSGLLIRIQALGTAVLASR
jgi:hypothetical protein